MGVSLAPHLSCKRSTPPERAGHPKPPRRSELLMMLPGRTSGRWCRRPPAPVLHRNLHARRTLRVPIDSRKVVRRHVEDVVHDRYQHERESGAEPRGVTWELAHMTVLRPAPDLLVGADRLDQRIVLPARAWHSQLDGGKDRLEVRRRYLGRRHDEVPKLDEVDVVFAIR